MSLTQFSTLFITPEWPCKKRRKKKFALQHQTSLHYALCPLFLHILMGISDEKLYVNLGRYSAVMQFLHCKYINCHKYNFSWCNIFHVLPVPFGHLITIPSTADKWYFQLYFWKYFFISYRLQFVHLNQCKNIFKNTTLRGFSHAYICTIICYSCNKI